MKENPHARKIINFREVSYSYSMWSIGSQSEHLSITAVVFITFHRVALPVPYPTDFEFNYLSLRLVANHS